MYEYNLEPVFEVQEKKPLWKLNIICNFPSSVTQKEDKLSMVFSLLLKLDHYRIVQIQLNRNLCNSEEIFLLNQITQLYYAIKKRIKFPLSFKKCSNKICLLSEIEQIFASNSRMIQFLNFLDNMTRNAQINAFVSKECKQPLYICKKVSDIIFQIYKKSEIYGYFEKKYAINNFQYDFFLNLLQTFSDNTLNDIDLQIYSKMKKLKEYNFENSQFNVQIYENPMDNLKFYTVKYNGIDPSDDKLKFLKDLIQKKILDLNPSVFFDLGKKLMVLSEEIKKFLIIYFPKLNAIEMNCFCLLLCADFLKISKIIPFLLDPKIEELFLDSKSDFFYLNHQDFGKLHTQIRLNDEEIDALKTHLRIESRMRLDQHNSNLIHVINNKFFNCRIAIDIAPSHWKDFSIDIRKMNKNIFSIFDLIQLKTLNSVMAAFLIFCILFRINITIAGEVDSGKTTTLNAIDLFIPPDFRKIYVEDVIETLEIPNKYGHQLKYRIDHQNSTQNNSKEKEIYRLLHRSGDLIILGEILTKEETHALFHCLSAGLIGLQTTHAAEINSLIRRWIIHFGITKDCLNDLGIILFMKKIGIQRKILDICELEYDQRKDQIKTHYFFNFNPLTGTWIQNDIFLSSRIFSKIALYYPMTIEKFKFIITMITEFFETEIKNSEFKTYFPLQNLYPKLLSIINS